MQTKTYCLTLGLKNDPQLIALYEEYHQAGNVWPEIIASIKQSGILDMKIYRLDTSLVMLLETTADFSFEAKAESDINNPKVQEWERLMEKFQHVDSLNPDQGKWRLMNNIFALSDN